MLNIKTFNSIRFRVHSLLWNNKLGMSPFNILLWQCCPVTDTLNWSITLWENWNRHEWSHFLETFSLELSLIDDDVMPLGKLLQQRNESLHVFVQICLFDVFTLDECKPWTSDRWFWQRSLWFLFLRENLHLSVYHGWIYHSHSAPEWTIHKADVTKLHCTLQTQT